MDTGTWTIAAERMKANDEPHRVALSNEALTLLQRARQYSTGDLVFSSARGRVMAANQLTRLLHVAGFGGRTTIHGWRSAFRDWASETTDAPHDVMERALAHKVGTAVTESYFRSDLLEKRRPLMQSWSGYLLDGER